MVVNEFHAVGKFTAFLYFRIGGIWLTIQAVFQNAVVKDNGFLHNHRNDSSQRVKVKVFDVGSVNKDLSRVNVIESHHKINESTLSTS